MNLLFDFIFAEIVLFTKLGSRNPVAKLELMNKKNNISELIL